MTFMQGVTLRDQGLRAGQQAVADVAADANDGSATHPIRVRNNPPTFETVLARSFAAFLFCGE